MSDILALARPDIVALKAYSHASWDPAFDRLHANELPWRAETDRSQAGLNRYPEPHPHVLAAASRRALWRDGPSSCCPAAAATSPSTCWCAASAVRASTTSSSARRPSACTPSPRASRAPRCATCRCCASVASRSMSRACWRPATRIRKIVFLCSPNNPTGNAMDPAAIETAAGGTRRTGRWWWSTRPTSNSPGDRSLTAAARALPESRGAAHAVEGLWPGRRARGLADRRARKSWRCSAR